ncbi:MAG: hypothetical protein Q4E75_01920 [bacterium]|jgi:hypothetical protein|nr:hypothetical protein [bacterium]
MEKLNLNKLIANDIVNYGMDKTTSFNYVVSLNDFLDDYDDESRDYIKSHINEIIDAVHQNENVAQLDYDEKRQEFDMVFYFDGLFNKLEKKIYNDSQEMGIDFEPEDVWQISYDIENSNEYNELVKSHINDKFKTCGREL